MTELQPKNAHVSKFFILSAIALPQLFIFIQQYVYYICI